MLSTWFCFHKRSNGQNVGQHYQDGHNTVRRAPECSLDAGESGWYSSLGNRGIVHGYSAIQQENEQIINDTQTPSFHALVLMKPVVVINMT